MSVCSCRIHHTEILVGQQKLFSTVIGISEFQNLILKYFIWLFLVMSVDFGLCTVLHFAAFIMESLLSYFKITWKPIMMICRSNLYQRRYCAGTAYILILYDLSVKVTPCLAAWDSQRGNLSCDLSLHLILLKYPILSNAISTHWYQLHKGN